MKSLLSNLQFLVFYLHHTEYSLLFDIDLISSSNQIFPHDEENHDQDGGSNYAENGGSNHAEDGGHHGENEGWPNGEEQHSIDDIDIQTPEADPDFKTNAEFLQLLMGLDEDTRERIGHKYYNLFENLKVIGGGEEI